jgi:hypothetical protein
MSVSWFKLARAGSRDGVSCDKDGAFIGSIALLNRATANGTETWQVRDTGAISCDLSRCFGLQIDISSKAAGLSAIARALNAGDVAKAQILALQLRFPDPASIAKAAPSRAEIIAFVRQLLESDFIKANWNPSQPRWPKFSPDSQGGRFAPKGIGTGPSNEPGIGHNSRNALPEEEATPGEEGTEAELAEDVLPSLGTVAGLAGEILLATTVPAGDAQEEEELERGTEEYERHHPWPKYLGGAENQELIDLPESLHFEYHRGLDEIAARWRGERYYRNLIVLERADLFGRIIRFTKEFDAKHGTKLYEAMSRNGFPEPDDE